MYYVYQESSELYFVSPFPDLGEYVVSFQESNVDYLGEEAAYHLSLSGIDMTIPYTIYIK